MKANCIRVTKEEVANLAKQLGISEAKAHANILLWSGDRQIDRLPTAEELKAFIDNTVVTNDSVGGSPVALSYLLDGGPGTIQSTGYLLHAISAAFELVSERLENIRNRYLDKLDPNPSSFTNDSTGALQEIKNIIESVYGQQGLDVLNDILNNATGFYAKEGNRVQSILDKLNSDIKDNNEFDSEGEIEQFVTAAPFFRQKLTSENKEDLEKQTTVVKERARKLAQELGLDIEVVSTMSGTYQGSSEISYRYVIKSGEQDKVDLFAALMADLSFEYQDAVIAANYTKDKSKTTAYEIVYKVPEGTTIEDVEATLKEVGIDGSSLSFNSNELSIIGFSEEEVQEIINKLKDKYEYKEHNPQNSRYLDNEYRRNAYKSWLDSERGKQNRKLYNACSKALAICEAAAPFYTKERGVDPDEEVDSEEAQRIKAARDAANNWKPQYSQLDRNPAQRKQLFFSGDANGSDKAWAKEAKAIGLSVKPYTVQDWDILSDEWKAKLDKEYQEIVQILGRRALPIDDYRGKLVRRDMMQADKADAIFAIGTIGNNGYVDGGTGYATTRGIQRGIPVYLYDRKNKCWKIWDKTKKVFVETAEPTITPNAALIGTRGDVVGKDASGRDIRDITEEEKHAIRSVIRKSFPRQNEVPASSVSRNTAPPMVTVEKSDVAALNATYANPNVKKFRVNEIAKRFSEKLAEKFDEKIAELDTKIAAAEKEGNTTEANRLFVQRQKLTKADVLTEMGGVRSIFNDIYAQYDPESVTSEAEANLYDELYDRPEEWTDEDFKNYINNTVAYKKAEYQKVRDNFWALAEEATLEIKKQERIIIDISSSSMSKDSVKNDSLNEDNTSSENPTNNIQDVEEKGAESWMNNFRSISGMSSLSVRTRAALQKLLELNKDGSVAYTDLWEERTIDPEWAHAVLLYGLADMVESSDMTRLLLELGKKYSFVRQLYRQNEDGTFDGMLVEDPQLMAAFYHDFRKDLTSYWASRGNRNFNTGEFEEDRTIALNSRENISFMLAAWQHNTETGLKVGGNDTIFNENGTINGEINEKMAKALAPLAIKFEEIRKRALTPDERNAAVINALDDNNKEGWNSLIKALRSIGIDQDEEDIRWALVDSKFQEGKSIYEGVSSVIAAIQIVYSQIKGNPTEFLKANSKGEYPVIDILTKFRQAYTTIAEEIKYLSQGETESSFHHMDKTRYSYNTPNYLGKIMKKLQGVQGEEKFNEFIESEYGRFNWFRKSVDGQQVWLNSWLEDLVRRPELRKNFRHKVVLDFNKKGFFEAGSLEYALGLLREFNAPLDVKIEGRDQEMAWYYVPMLSDTDSSEFIQFTKDTKEGYQDRLLAKMRLTVYQELSRIALVKKRAEKIANKEAEPIANFDDRGKKFCFFPALNTWKDAGNNSFLSIMESYASQIDKAAEDGNTAVKESLEAERASFIDSVLREIIESDVDETYKRYTELGVFDKTEGGAFKYLKGSKNQDLHMQNNKTFIKEVLDIARQTPDKYANFIKRAEQYLENPLSLTYSERSKLFEYASKFNTRNGEVREQDDHREMISKYVYNSRFATSQIVQIFATDYAYYKNAVDFQKRFKEVHAPSLRLFTLAEYNGKRIGRDTERSIYLADEKIVSNTYDELKQAIDWRVVHGQLSRASGDYILAQYRKINVSDAQAYRCLSSYRAIMGMTGQWNDAMQKAYDKFRSGKWGIEEFTTIFQTKKPYLYTQVGIDSQVNGEQIKVGAQHKNSEFLLLAMIPSIVNGTPMQSASKLAALNKIMEEGYEEGRGIDVVNFTSAVKVGNQGIIEFTYDDRMVNIPYGGKIYDNVAALRKHLDSLLAGGKITGAEHNKALEPYLLANKGVDYIEQYLKEKMFVDGKDNPSVIHTFSYEDYGIQTQTPEHIIDHEQLFGTQIRRLIGADITSGTILTVGGVQMTAEQWWQTYNGLLVDNIVDSYAQVSEKFSSPEKLHALLVETIKGSDRYPKDLLNAIRLVDEIGVNGQPTGRKRFNIPLFDHATADVVESLINSVIKDTVTKQKIRGGSCIQVSSFGLSDKLSVVYEGEGENKRVKYMECYMPAYSKDFYEGLLIPVDKNGKEITDGSQPAGYIFNPDLLDDDLRKAIGYRVPTEDKYSMAPLYIKGFLPQQNGSAIMLPAEITTLSGSDFDIDKMYIMLPEFDVIKYDKESARRDYEQFNRKYGHTQSWIENVFNAIMDENFNEEEDESNDASKAFSDWWKENKEKYKLKRPRYRRINGSFKKTEDGFAFDDGLSKKTNPTRADRERARKKRNNAIIDMMYSVLTNADTLQRFVKPGGYDEVKKQAFIERILSNVSYDELRSRLGIAGDAKISDVLNKKTIDELDDIASAFGKMLDPLSVTTQMHFHKQNSAGSKAIGIYAVNNAGQALLQHSKLSLAKSNDPSVSKIVLFGKEYTDLNKVVNENGQYITNNEAQYLAAAVDNGKDPTLEDNGQNDFTYNMSNLLIRLGVGHKEVAAIMNQPIIKDMASAVTKGAADGKSRDEIVLEVLQKYADKAGVSYTDIKVSEDIGVSLEDMYRDRCLGAEKQGTEFYKRQLMIGLWFESNGDSAQFLNNSTQNLRGDAQNAAAGPRVIDTVVRQIRIENSIKEEYGLYDSSKNYSVEEMKNHPLGFIIAFQQFGIKGTADILEEYFPHYSSDFMGTLKNLIQRTKNRSIPVDLAQKLFDAAVTYRLSGLPLLNSLKKGKEWVAAPKEEVVKYFYYKFPEIFKHAKETNPVVYEANGVEVHFNDIPLIQVLKTVPSGRNNPIVSIVMDNAGRLTKEGKQRLTQSWESLVYSGDERAITLAVNLFAYSLIRYDGKFAPSGFAHLAPVAVEESCAGYSDRMEAMRQLGLNIDGDSDFRTLFLRNNTDNRTLFPKITGKEVEALKDSIDAGFISMDVAAQCPSIAKITGEKSASVTYFNGFCIQDGKEMKYYILEPISKKEADIIEVTPLGVKGKMVEYFIDSDFATSKSRIIEDKKHAEENSELAQSDDTGFSVPMSPEDSYDIDVTTDDEGNEICK